MLPFAHPDRLWLLLALLPLLAWMAWGSRRRLDDWRKIGQSARPPGDGSWGWFLAAVLVVLALAQPRWGKVPGTDPASGHDLILLVDVSRSMAAQDAVPDRLGVAIEAGSSLLLALEPGQGDRAGVVAFAGRGVVRCPLTSHLGTPLEVLRSLRPGDVEPGGTDLGAALDEAIGAFDQEEHLEGRTIVLISDGEDHVGSWAPEVDRLKARGIVVHSVAIGDPSRAHPVPSGRPKGSKKDRGPEAETRRSDVAFEAISKATGGVMIPLGRASSDLGPLFRDRIGPTARRLRDDFRIPERVERFGAFLLPAIGLGLTASWPGFTRRRGRRLAYSSLLVALVAIGAAPLGRTVAELVARGQGSYASGRFLEALDSFEAAIESVPTAAIPRFDAASALFQLGRYSEAIQHYTEARSRGDARLSIKIDYALGNSHLALGDIAEALARYDSCLASTLDGEGLEKVRLDAAANREFAARKVPPPPESPETGGPSPTGSKNKRPSSSSSKKDEDAPDPSNPTDRSPPSDNPPDGPAEPSRSNSGPRGAGGAGGGGQAPPESGSPGARLDSALRDVREARSRRPPDPPRSGSKGVGKDW